MKKNATLKDIAEAAGLNVMTVSRALHDSPLVAEKTKKRVQKLAEQMHYVPNLNAKFLRGSQTNIVGLIVEDNTNPYCAHIIRDVQRLLRERGYYTLTFNNFESVEDEIEIVNNLCSFRVAGVLLTPAMGNFESVRILQRQDIPYVLTSRYASPDADNYILIDNEKAAYLAAQHMLQRHRRKTIFLNQIRGITSVDARTAGYRRALKEAGIRPEEDWITYDCGTREQGYAAMTKVLAETSGPLNVLCYNDYVADGVLASIYAREIEIPKDIAVMGIDNIESFAIGRRKLSTVDVQIHEVARLAVERLLALIAAKEQGKHPKARQIVLEPKLIEGGTT